MRRSERSNVTGHVAQSTPAQDFRAFNKSLPARRQGLLSEMGMFPKLSFYNSHRL